MTTTTVFSDTSDGRIASQSTSYTTARAGGTLTAVTAGANFPVGQSSDFAGGVDNYEVNEGFVRFDTSSIPDTDTISAAELSLSLNFDQSTTDFTVEARVSDWGTTLTTADWVAGASLSGLTRVGTLASSGIGSTGAYKAFTEDGTNLRTAINVTGDTRLLLCSSRHVAGTSPASGVGETLYFDSADAAGTTKDPKLVITHAAALTAIGKAVELRWALRQAIGDASTLNWAVRAAASDTLDLRWGVRATLADTLELRWGVRTPVGDEAALQWALRSALANSLDARWAVRQAVADDLDARWSVRQAVGDEVDLRWEVLALLSVGLGLDLRWSVRAAVADTLDVLWAVREAAGEELDLRWALRQAVADDLSLLWDVESFIAAVQRERSRYARIGSSRRTSVVMRRTF